MTTPNPLVAIIARVAMGAMTETSKRTDNKMSAKAVADARPDIVEAVTKAVAASPEIQNATNTEAHFWQKRSFWASAYASLAAVTPVAYAFFEYMNNNAIDGKVTVATFIFGAMAAYASRRAGQATKPLGA